ncbi:hypothetical protein [Dermacoccus nishinomiyaensis]|uniref:hypothetical protein n=1 Tax=Dermacoccus nishinomiyaensis TaxID=1274 RepID=UPI0033BD1FD6
MVFGEDVYPGILMKAAALVHSLAKNRALVDGQQADGARCALAVPRPQRDSSRRQR